MSQAHLLHKERRPKGSAGAEGPKDIEEVCMSEAKGFTQAMGADGSAVNVPINDYRNERGPWPIKFAVPKDQATHWLQYLQAECRARKWPLSSTGEDTQRENSGSITIRTSATVPCSELIVVWKRRRGGLIRVRARMAGSPELSRAEAEDFLGKVNEHSRGKVLQQFYQRGHLSYWGLPWRGEAWLGSALRLGPPSRQYDRALYGPRVILVDAEVEAIDAEDARSVFHLLLQELSVFLTVVLQIAVKWHRSTLSEWTLTVLQNGQVTCEPRQLGYHEAEQLPGMPARGTSPPVPLSPVSRPDLTIGPRRAFDQQHLPGDVVVLWQGFTSLPAEIRGQFLQAGNTYRRALLLWQEERTLSLALMVVACEALKLPGPRYDGHNAPSVVKALLGQECADALLGKGSQPLGIRNAHLHRGEFKGGEFFKFVFMTSDYDPTFDQRHRIMSVIAPAAIIEWLRKGGAYTLPPKRFSGRNRWGGKVVALLVVAAGIVLASGVVLGWFLHAGL